MTVQRSSILKVGDKLRLFHRNNGQPVRDADRRPIELPADGHMEATVGWVQGERRVNVTAIDAAGSHFVEEGVYVLEPGEKAPRGGRYALLMDDDSDHTPEEWPDQ